MHPTRTLRDKRGQTERHLWSERGNVSVIVLRVVELTISPAQITRVGGDTLFLFAACEAHQCVKLGDSLRF